MNSTSTVGDVYPSLIYDNAPAAIDWLCKAFGFTRRLVVPGPNERIEHSELSIGAAVIMVSSPKPEMGRVSPKGLPGASQALSIYVDDPDAHYKKAKAAGAVILRELRDDHGARGYMAKDPEGHIWYFGNYRPGAHWDDATSTTS